MAEVKNYTGMKNATSIKAQVRIDVMEVVVNALREVYGEDNVAKVGSNEYAVVVGTVDDKDGFPQDICATIKPTVKEWESRKTAKKSYEKYDIFAEANAYALEIAEKEEEKAAKAKAKEEKIARDKKAREEKKTEEK